jgi:hypothetical protein
MATKSDVFVSPHPDGGWQVKRAGAQRAYRRTVTQKAAIFIGRRLAKKRQVELVIQRGDDGRIREKDSHGRDSKRRKG